jgi:hypothetical protein
VRAAGRAFHHVSSRRRPARAVSQSLEADRRGQTKPANLVRLAWGSGRRAAKGSPRHFAKGFDASKESRLVTLLLPAASAVMNSSRAWGSAARRSVSTSFVWPLLPARRTDRRGLGCRGSDLSPECRKRSRQGGRVASHAEVSRPSVEAPASRPGTSAAEARLRACRTYLRRIPGSGRGFVREPLAPGLAVASAYLVATLLARDR